MIKWINRLLGKQRTYRKTFDKWPVESIEFFVLFCQDGKTKIGEHYVEFKDGEVKKVCRMEMYEWMAVAHHEKVLLEIFEAQSVCDLS